MEVPAVAQLQESLRRKHKNENSNEIVMEFFKNGLLYFVEGGAKCWWCSAETNESATEMLHLFSIQETTQVKRFKEVMAEQLLRCTSCIAAYYEAKVRLRERYCKMYDADRVDEFFKGIEAWDAARIVGAFGQTSPKDNATGKNALYDALRAKENILFHEDVAQASMRYIKSRLDSGDLLNMGKRLLPGFFTLCFSDDQQVRGWTWRSLKWANDKGQSTFDSSSTTLVFAQLLRMLAQIIDHENPYSISSKGKLARLDEITFMFSCDDLWRGLHATLSRLTKSNREDLVELLDGFPAIICKRLLGITGPEFTYAIRTFALILEATEKEHVWPRISGEMGICTPKELALFAINHTAVREKFCEKESNESDLSENALFKASRFTKPALEWVTPFIESLCLPQDCAAVEALLDGLVFGIRLDPNVSIAYSAIAVHAALAIIKHCFRLQDTEKFTPDRRFVISSFLNKNMHLILEIAQGRDPLSECELLILGTEDLIDIMLREDLDATFRAFSETSEMAMAIRNEGGPQPAGDGSKNGAAPPVLIQLPLLWEGVLKDPQNTNVAKKALFATSYLLLFDKLPEDLVDCLPEQWRDAYIHFEVKRRRITDMLAQLLQVLNSSLEAVDHEARLGFEHEILSSLLRHLISPTETLHSVILQIFRPASLETSSDDDDEQGGSRTNVEFNDTECDLVCYELFKRHGDNFFGCLTEIASDCKVLVNHNRPAYSCSANVAMLGRSSISAVNNSVGSAHNSEAMAKLFFSFCNLLGAILEASSDDASNGIHVSSNSNNSNSNASSIYSASVLKVFKTVYTMLTTVEFSGIVRMVKNSSHLDETEAMDALSTCVSQMLNYLVSGDELGVAAGIIKTFGLIATGLAATPGTSMLYPTETVQALIDGKSGTLTRQLRDMLSTIIKHDVWEPRSIVASKTKPVQIIIDDEEAFAGLKELEFLDLVDEIPMYTEERGDRPESSRTTPNIASSSLGSSSSLATHAVLKAPEIVKQKPQPQPGQQQKQLPIYEKPSSLHSNSQQVQHVQLTPEDAVMSTRRKQMSMDHWFARAKTGGSSANSSTLTSRASSTAKTPATRKPASSAATRKPKAGGSTFLSQMRSSFANERKDLQLNAKLQPTVEITRVTKVPRSLSTVPVNKWDSRQKMDLEEPAGEPMESLYIRNASKDALAEMEQERKNRVGRPISSSTSSGRPRHADSAFIATDDSAESSSDDNDDDQGDGGGLAGLIKIRKTPARVLPKKSIKFITLNGDLAGGSGRAHGGGSAFFDQQARDRALAEQKAKMRLTPSLNNLHKRLLGWKYEETGDFPPDMKRPELVKVQDQFENCEEYARVFEPLLLLESWAQLQRAKEETVTSEPCDAVLQSRMSVDDFQDITFTTSIADCQDVADHDILVFSESLSREKRYAQGIAKAGMGSVNAASGKGSAQQRAVGINGNFAGKQTFLAKVQNRVFGKDSVQVVVRVFFQGARLALFLNKLVLKSVWQFFKLYSLTPVHREYAALRSLPYLDEKLVEEILAPRPILHEVLSRREVQACMKTHALNQPQAEAVVSAIKRNHGFTLIQGPPGTGKTKTILGLSGALLTQAKRKEAVGAIDVDQEDDDILAPKPKKNNKLLICAPSNAAVDEIVKRLKNGIRDDKGRTFYPSVVRVGLSDSISSTVRDTTLDFLMEKALNAFSTGQNSDDGDHDGNSVSKDGSISSAQSSLLLSVAGRNRREGKVVNMAATAKEEHKSAVETQKSLRQQLDMVNREIQEIEMQVQNVDPSDTAAMSDLRDKSRQAHKKKNGIYQMLDKERGRAREASKTIDATKHKIRLQILQKTDILCCTLSGSGHEILTSMNCSFDTVIIDEAAQSVELSCLIPLKYGCERCILVGDPNQLPPTVISQAAAQHMYNQSMFVRIQKNSPESVNLLSIQYRMHPEISAFPSKLFYESRLKDGPEMAKKQRAPWHSNKQYPPFMFYNIWMGKEQAGRSHSVFNTAEADAAVQLVQNICRDYPKIAWKQKIGIITPYKQQLRVLIDKFAKSFGSNVSDAIEFNTVDGFQGQEKEIIIFSCVRAGQSGVGFLADERRMNVGLTRARKSLFILGNSNMLVSNPLWKSLIDDAKKRDLLKDCTLPMFGRHVGNSLLLESLFKESSADAGKGDGEGVRAEFIMEQLDQEQLDKLNDALVKTESTAGTRRTSHMAVSSDSGSDSSDDDDDDAAGGGKPRRSALQEMATSATRSTENSGKRGHAHDVASDAGKKRQRLSSESNEKHKEDGIQPAVRADPLRSQSQSNSPSSTRTRNAAFPSLQALKVAVPVGGHRRAYPSPTEATAEDQPSKEKGSVAKREKQRSSLFIPAKVRRRDGRGLGSGGSGNSGGIRSEVTRNQSRPVATPISAPGSVPSGAANVDSQQQQHQPKRKASIDRSISPGPPSDASSTMSSKSSKSNSKPRHKRRGGLFRAPVDTQEAKRGRGSNESNSRDDMISEMLERRGRR